MLRQHPSHTQRPFVGMAHGEKRAGASTSPGRARAVILAVDDEPDVLQILEWFLISEGFEVMTASSGAEALQHIEERLPDLIITDYRMPGMSGLVLCEQLRQHRTAQHIPIILHTATQTAALPSQGQLYHRVVTKPSDALALVAEVRRLLARSH
jgi:CheY-like chemotaxis protein